MSFSTSTAPTALPDAYDADGAALYLNRSRRTVTRWTAAGLLPSYLIGGRRYYRRGDLDRFIASCRSEVPTP